MEKSEVKPAVQYKSFQGFCDTYNQKPLRSEGWNTNVGLKIGDVARLTGISTDTIRAWERRYRVVKPNRGDNNNRYYTQQHVGKLISIKRLVDTGQAIGIVCRLSDEELEVRSTDLLAAGSRSANRLVKRWVVVSVQQPSWLKACVRAQPEIEARWVSSLDEFKAAPDEFAVIDMPSLSEINEKLVLSVIPENLSSCCLVVYRFASRRQLRSLTAKGFRLLKGPLEPFALVNLLRGDQPATQ